VLCLLVIVPSIDFHCSCNRRFKKAYADVGLMQAGLINESNKRRGILENLEEGGGGGQMEMERVEEKEKLR
jgi:hypothetical protein